MAISSRRAGIDGPAYVDARGRLDAVIDGNGFLDAVEMAKVQLAWRSPFEFFSFRLGTAASSTMRRAHVAVAASVVLLGALVAALVILSRFGVYFPLVRGLWLPWPPDEWKAILALLGIGAVVLWGTRRRWEASGGPVRRVWSFLTASSSSRWTLIGLLVLAGLALFVTVLVVLAGLGIYIRPLSSLWLPWPQDEWKAILGALVFLYLFLRYRRNARRAPSG